MNTATRNGCSVGSWRDLYQAAICEPDMSKVPDRIAEAEAALILSARELFYTDGRDSDEGESMDDAMFILQALRSSLKRHPVGSAAIREVSDSLVPQRA
jgi:hypothetical protein